MYVTQRFCFHSSGFVEPENVKDYAQNREAYVNKGKGFQFKKAVTDMDAQLNATQVIYMNIIHMFIREVIHLTIILGKRSNKKT